MNNLIKGEKFEWEAVIGLEIHAQVKSMEKDDSQLSTKRKSFDSDLERLQRERGDMMGQQSGPGGGARPPMGQGPGMMR